METYSPSVLACLRPAANEEPRARRCSRLCDTYNHDVVGASGGLCVSAFLRFCSVRDRDRVFDRRYTDIPKHDSCRFNQQPNRSIRTPVRIAEQGLKHRSCQAVIHICRCVIHASRSCPACIHVSMSISHVPMHVLRRSRINPRTTYRSWYV